MKLKRKKDFASAIRQIVGFKPDKPPRKPEKAPSKEQLEQGWKICKR